MNKIRVNEAFLEAKKKGIKVQKQEIAALMWADSLPKTQRQNMVNLFSGKVYRISHEQVNILCKVLNVDANFLFDIQK